MESLGLGACLHQARAFVIKKKIILLLKLLL